MFDKALDQLTKWIDQKIAIIQHALADGSARDFAEYQRLVGEIKGLLFARLNIQDLRSKLEEFNDN
jgi:hypothetical protein